MNDYDFCKLEEAWELRQEYLADPTNPQRPWAPDADDAPDFDDVPF